MTKAREIPSVIYTTGIMADSMLLVQVNIWLKSKSKLSVGVVPDANTMDISMVEIIAENAAILPYVPFLGFLFLFDQFFMWLVLLFMLIFISKAYSFESLYYLNLNGILAITPLSKDFITILAKLNNNILAPMTIIA